MKMILKYFQLILAINLIFLFKGYSQIQDSTRQKNGFIQKLEGLYFDLGPVYLVGDQQASAPGTDIMYGFKRNINLGIGYEKNWTNPFFAGAKLNLFRFGPADNNITYTNGVAPEFRLGIYVLEKIKLFTSFGFSVINWDDGPLGKDGSSWGFPTGIGAKYEIKINDNYNLTLEGYYKIFNTEDGLDHNVFGDNYDHTFGFSIGIGIPNRKKQGDLSFEDYEQLKSQLEVAETRIMLLESDAIKIEEINLEEGDSLIKVNNFLNKIEIFETAMMSDIWATQNLPEGENFILLGSYGSKEGAKQFIYRNRLEEYEYKIILNTIDDYEFFRAAIGPIKTIRESIGILKRIRETLPKAAFIKLVKLQ